ncbi:retrovirus-related pol polyprotein from transposon TNT 1-94 [Tanacetum coccineum]
MQVNVQFLQQLQPEWSRFVTVVKQRQEIDTVSYHKLFDVLKQFQNEVNDIRSERLARSANPLALLAAAQPYSDKLLSGTKTSKIECTIIHAIFFHTTNDPEQARGNKTEDTTPRYNNDNQSGQFGNQRTMTVAGARETVGSPVVQQNGIQCFNCKGFGHYARECRKPKRVKDYAYHKEKMMMCKQAEQGVPLQAEQADWLEDTDEEIDEQELEAHYSYMAKIQEVSPEETSSTSQPLEQVQNHDENDVFANMRRHSEQPESINDTYVLEKDDSNVIPDSSNICTNDNQVYTWTQKALKTKKIWMPPRLGKDENQQIVQLILFIVDSGCTKHMTGNLKLLCNFVEKFMGTIHFGNDQLAPILGYGDLIQGNVTIKRVYYVEGLNHNLFSVGQFCDANLEVAFRKSTCFVRDLQGNDLLTGSRGSGFTQISLQENNFFNSICFMA